MSAVLTEIINLLVSGLTAIASGIGSGLSALVEGVFVDTSATTPKLTTFGAVVIIFAGVSLAIGLSRWVVNYITSLGNN